MKNYSNINFDISYRYASEVQAYIADENIDNLEKFYYIYKSEIIERISKYNKNTLLHLFIEFCIKDLANFFIEEMKRDAEYDLIFDYLIEFFDVYNVEFEFKKIEYIENDFDIDFPIYCNKCNEYINYLYDMFLGILPTFVQDIFYLLYGNREFLLKFNRCMSWIVKNYIIHEKLEILNEKGYIKRCSYLPIWMKNGVFYRDRGRCINCGKDLTGLILSGEKIHYDHVVPLKKYGVNDPTNIQLLCELCNLKKSGEKIFTSTMYPRYW